MTDSQVNRREDGGGTKMLWTSKGECGGFSGMDGGMDGGSGREK